MKKYGKLHHQAEQVKNQEQYLTRRLSNIQSDIISEKILLEKARIEEVDETRRVQRAGETRNLLQKEVEEVEQKDTMAKFELFELNRVHEELQKSLEAMKKQNNQLVEPVLEKLRREVCCFDLSCRRLLPVSRFLLVHAHTDCRLDGTAETHRGEL